MCTEKAFEFTGYTVLMLATLICMWYADVSSYNYDAKYDNSPAGLNSYFNQSFYCFWCRSHCFLLNVKTPLRDRSRSWDVPVIAFVDIGRDALCLLFGESRTLECHATRWWQLPPDYAVSDQISDCREICLVQEPKKKYRSFYSWYVHFKIVGR